MRDIALYIVAFIVILVGGIFVYFQGYRHGSLAIQAEWDQERQEFREFQDQLIADFAQKEFDYRAENDRILQELVETRRHYEVALAHQRSTYEQRLLQSENRAQVYQRQAEAGAASCRDLASHAARLDRALEEGRGLVRELGESLGFRDQQLRMLGQRLLNERSLIGDEDGT